MEFSGRLFDMYEVSRILGYRLRHACGNDNATHVAVLRISAIRYVKSFNDQNLLELAKEFNVDGCPKAIRLMLCTLCESGDTQAVIRVAGFVKRNVDVVVNEKARLN